MIREPDYFQTSISVSLTTNRLISSICAVSYINIYSLNRLENFKRTGNLGKISHNECIKLSIGLVYLLL